MSKTFTREDVAKHNKNGDLWIVVDSTVYDLSRFSALHPGGLAALLDEEVAGRDATDTFFALHRFEVIQRPQYARLKIGHIEGEEPQISKPPPGSLSQIPFAEPTWLSKGYYTPYYNESHRRLQTAMRKFTEEVVFPDAQAREEDGKRASPHIFEARARLNLPVMALGPGPHLKGLTLMDGAVKPEEFDCFHELVMIQEGSRLHARGYSDGLAGGTYIALPPVMKYAAPEIRDRIVKDAFAGQKFLSLAVTEAYAGSDVAGIRTRATKTQGGWIVNGSKKWITNGMFADYFVTACRNEEEGGIVVLLIERGKGIETRLIRTSYSTAAGTAFITFDDVFVPDTHVLGPSTDGLRIILSNFNHERWAMACGSIGTQRAIVEECFKWAVQRKVFGKPLISQAVIRSKLAAMIARVESGQNWLENVTYQMTKMNNTQQAALLAGQIAFLKMHASRAGQDTARDAVQIFGGRGITRTGMGKYIEHYHRTLLIDAVGGGAEDIIGDLGVRQALRSMPRNVRL
ncbi:acyl-CoA dehydrogenase NM domain-like protein [Marasmius fiardii PR-910]|nr:acyl-CoA dehydrogenase NM domain-like protein [Marasmius fiardii PR-910]